MPSPESASTTVTPSRIAGLRNGDYHLLYELRDDPSIMVSLTTPLRNAVFGALLHIIGDSRGVFSSGVRKESAVALRMLSFYCLNRTGDATKDAQVFIRKTGVEELKALKLDRHLGSAKEDVSPAALEFACVAIRILQCDADELLASQEYITMVENHRRSQAPSAPPPPPERPRSGSAAAASGGGGPPARPNRISANAPAHSANPLFQSGTGASLMTIQSPDPVVSFVKHFGVGGVPSVPVWSKRAKYISGEETVEERPSNVADSIPLPTAAAEGTGTISPVAEGDPSSTVALNNNGISSSSQTQPQFSSPSAVGSTNVQDQQHQGSGTNLDSPAGAVATTEGRQDSTNTVSSERANSMGQEIQPARASSIVPPSGGSFPSSPAESPRGGGGARRGSMIYRIRIPPLPTERSEGYKILKRYFSTEDPGNTPSRRGHLLGWGSNKLGELFTDPSLPENRMVALPVAREGATSLHPQNPASPLIVDIGNGLESHRYMPCGVSCGAQYTLLLTVKGEIFSCGAGEWGQLGIGDFSSHQQLQKFIQVIDSVPCCPRPIAVPFQEGVEIVKTYSGFAYAAAIDAAGQVSLWGNNNHSQITVGAKLTQNRVRVMSPWKVKIRGVEIVDVACGSFFVLALTSSNVVLSWGIMTLLGLGQEDEVRRQVQEQYVCDSVSKEKRPIVTYPCKITALDGKKIVRVACGQWHAVALGANGSVYTWGVGHQGRLGHGTTEAEFVPRLVERLEGLRIIDISCGSFHSCAIALNGSVWTFGDNASGQCGTVGSSTCLHPHRVNFPAPGKPLAVSCGREHSCILTSVGELWVFGSGVATGVGLGCRPRCVPPRKIAQPYLCLGFAQGINHAVALVLPRLIELTPIGPLYVRDECAKTLCIPLRTGLASVALGASFSLFVTGRGEIYGIGNNDWNQLGVIMNSSSTKAAAAENSETTMISVVTKPIRIPKLLQVRVSHVAAGYAFAFALSDKEDVYFWGNNNHSQSGMGSSYLERHTRVEEPVLVPQLCNKKVVQIACGSFFAMALTVTGDVYSWGVLDCCGLGTVDAASSTIGDVLASSATPEKKTVVSFPVQIESLKSIISIACGQWHALALSESGHIFAWGIGQHGRLGTGSTASQPRPIHLSTSNGPGVLFSSIACGSFNGAAIASNGDLYTWGDNEFGQCGIESHLEKEIKRKQMMPSSVPGESSKQPIAIFAYPSSSQHSQQDDIAPVPDPNEEEVLRTLLVPTFTGIGDIRKVVCGRRYMACITAEDLLLCTGSIQHGPSKKHATRQFLPQILVHRHDAQPIDIFAGSQHMLALFEKERPSENAVVEAIEGLKFLRHNLSRSTAAAAPSASSDTQS